ncbi:uncharacterized protein LOC128673374 isoform X2 [Plodia interpunctella]|uniref:uncharacterized protein LOC128673374 isoform X2 n=1 Tax=Plodia interpunctella TaxID=58824 RepID=UPI0023684C3A|nr:uncharacterized protein LOC128673374 isoform X2 [Plodia interpunctella]
MEFLDSLDFETKKKPNRVRSWYLYEQFKSLENNQLEAAKRLKNRCYQEKILRRELSERRVRRSFCDPCDSRSDCLNTSLKSTHTRTSLDASNDDFLETCSQLECDSDHEDETELSHDDSQTELPSDFKSVTDLDDSIASVIENLKDSENITDEIKEELEFVKHGIAENITLQLEAAKENVQCLEKLTDFCEVEKFSQKTQSNNDEEIKAIIVPKESRCDTLYDNNLIAAWMKLVNFAYQVIKLNHGGNCYSDYSSQFLTAVLACDVLRRGLNRMCDILQPYICPIQFDDDEENTTSCYKKVKRKSNDTQKLNLEK